MSYENIANSNPYFDLFDKEDNYLRLLFNPKRALQSRELIELGSVHQNQIAQFADHVFEDGSKVMDAEIDVDFKKNYMNINSRDTDDNIVDPESFIGFTVEGRSSGARAKITNALNDDYLLYFDYHGGTFQQGEEINVEGSPLHDAIIEDSEDAIGKAIVADIQPGVVYVRNHFVYISESQETVVQKRGNDGHKLIGYVVNEEVVKAGDDPKLYDPANNTLNYNAPGADRYKMSIELTAIDIDDEQPDNFYKSVEVNNVAIIRHQNEPQYSQLGDVLARRRYEESGSYVVDSFPIRLRTNPNDEEEISIGLEQGLAYVYGYRNQTFSTAWINTPKARTYRKENNELIYSSFGPSIDAYIVSDNFKINFKPEVEFFSSFDGDGEKLGEGRLMGIGQPKFSGGPEWLVRLYFANMPDMYSIFSSVRSLKEKDGDGVANIRLDRDLGLPKLSNKKNSEYIFKLNNEAVRDVQLNETNYDFTRHYFDVTPNENNEYVLSSGNSNETFYTSSQNGIVYIEDEDTGKAVETYSATHGTDNTELVIEIEESPLPDSINVIVRMNKNEVNPRSKTLTETTDTVTTDSDGVADLDNTDVYKIKKIVRTSDDNDIDVDSVDLDTGQRDVYYDFGSVSSLDNNTKYDITYEYFSHSGTGDYFAANSYESYLYEDIPTYVSEDGSNEFQLRDCLDFRRSIDEFDNGFDSVDFGSNILVDYNYYLPRIDKVYIDKEGKFGVKEGVPGDDPDTPNGKANTMTLYELHIPAYTFDARKVKVNDKQVRGYTMEDIENIEERVNTLEYYSALNQLEQDSKDRGIYDNEGFEKTKNGILVDNFVGHNVSAVNHPEYRCSIDRGKQELRAPFSSSNIDLESKEDSTDLLTNNIREHEHIYTLDYDTEEFINQPFASEHMSVNPYNITTWSGTMSLQPNTDNWTDTERAPDVQVNLNGENNNWEELEDAFGTQWNDWQELWTGREESGSTTTTRTVEGRSGERLNVESETIRRRIGDRVIDTSIVPWMRSRDIDFLAHGMKPNTTLSAYFDDVDVTQYCAPIDGSVNDDLVTDDQGRVRGIFTIPNNPEHHFRVGTKTFKLQDHPENPETIAEAKYWAMGLRQTRQDTIVSMDVPEFSRETAFQTRTHVETTNNSNDGTQWVDPLAETFLVSEEEGIYLNNITLYFHSKPEEGESPLPITVRIVETDNGYPSQNVVPYSEVSLPVEDVNTSEDSSEGTTFEFSDPVYLEENTEYAIVVISNSNHYRLWVAEKGEEDIQTGDVINRQPYAGVFFKSQNSSTWNAKQNKDLKFKMDKCVFDDSSNGLLDLVNEDIGNVSYDFSTMMVNIDDMVHEKTNIDWQYNFRDYESNTFYDIELKTNVHFSSRRTLEDISGQEKPVIVRGTLSTSNTNLTPTIHRNRSSLVIVKNEVTDEGDYFDAGTYVTRSTRLENPSDDLRVIVDLKLPSGSDVDFYFRTGKYVPRFVYIDTDHIGGELAEVNDLNDYKNETVYVYWFYGTESSPNNKMLLGADGVINKKDTDTDASPEDERLFLKSISNTSDFKDPDSLTDIEEIYLVVGDDQMDDAIVEEWESGENYSTGDYVFYEGGLWRATSREDGDEPSLNGNAWDYIPSAKLRSEVKSNEIAEWHSMRVKQYPDESLDTDKEFFEYILEPDDLDDDFTSFAIKIHMKAGSYVDIPKVKNLRALAVY